MPAPREHRHDHAAPAGPAPVRRGQPEAPAFPAGGTVTGMSPEHILILQRTAGNSAVRRSVERQHGHGHGHDHRTPAGHGQGHGQHASPALTTGLPVQRMFKKGGRSRNPAAPAPEPPPSVAVHPHDDPKRLPDSNVADPLAQGVEAYRNSIKKEKKEEAKRIRDDHARRFEGFL